MSKPEAKKALELEIKLAKPGDEEIISSLIFEAFSPFRNEYTPDAFAYTAVSAETVRGRFSEGPMWLAYIGDEPVGTVSGLPEDERFYIRSMAIKPSVQRGGIGQRLLETLEMFAREAGYKKLYLYTTFVLPAAKRLYEKNGFYVLRETPPEEWYDMGGLEMEKNIAR
ncbi:MAG: GNAT family N-acetyltransferase [Pyrinomonadaceae bacterium]